MSVEEAVLIAEAAAKVAEVAFENGVNAEAEALVSLALKVLRESSAPSGA